MSSMSPDEFKPLGIGNALKPMTTHIRCSCDNELSIISKSGEWGVPQARFVCPCGKVWEVVQGADDDGKPFNKFNCMTEDE